MAAVATSKMAEYKDHCQMKDDDCCDYVQHGCSRLTELTGCVLSGTEKAAGQWAAAM